MSDHKTKVLIIGSGPAGYTAGIYTARAGLEPIIVSGYQAGGQLTTTTEIENFPAFPDPIQGTELMERMKSQCKNLGVRINHEHIKEIDVTSRPFKAMTDSGKTFTADTIIAATGASPQNLGSEGENKFRGFGVSYCATCDGFFYRNRDVIVVGGGNAAAIEALHLAETSKSVTLIHRRNELRAEKIMADRLMAHPKIKLEWDTVITEIIGQDTPRSMTGVKVRNVKSNQERTIEAEGIFIAIGYRPNTEIFKGKIDLDESGYIITDENSTKTSLEGIFAAGDVANPRYKQAILAAAKGCEAALDVEEYIKSVRQD